MKSFGFEAVALLLTYYVHHEIDYAFHFFLLTWRLIC